MGLDQVIYRKEHQDAEQEELFYFRKMNALQGYFENKFNVENTQSFVLTEEIVTDILNRASSALIQKDHELFPPQGGFFYGSTEANERYWYGVNKVIQAMSSLLTEHKEDLNKGLIFYWSSW